MSAGGRQVDESRLILESYKHIRGPACACKRRCLKSTTVGIRCRIQLSPTKINSLTVKSFAIESIAKEAAAAAAASKPLLLFISLMILLLMIILLKTGWLLANNAIER